MGSDVQFDLDHSRAGDNPLDGGQEDRVLFRRERLQRFQLGNHFPGLVSPRLVPSWRLAAAGMDSVQDRGKAARSPATARYQRDESKITKPTVSNSRKHLIKYA